MEKKPSPSAADTQRDLARLFVPRWSDGEIRCVIDRPRIVDDQYCQG
jgi:hypothetical protein